MKKPNSSMQLTRAADYGVRVMIQLTALKATGGFHFPIWLAPQARRRAFSRKSCNPSRAPGSSPRARSVGRFSHFPARRRASMREVIEAIDGAICLNLCLIPGRSCSRKARCPRIRLD